MFDEITAKKIEQENKMFDTEIYDLENSFEHSCLSLQQPWAALVVAGMKRFEGRQWSTNY